MLSRVLHSGKVFRTAAASAILSALTIETAYAYIDPGTGSYMLQVVAAGLFAAIFAIAGFWRKIVAGLASILGRRPRD